MAQQTVQFLSFHVLLPLFMNHQPKARGNGTIV